MAYTDAEIQQIAIEQLEWDSRLLESDLQVSVKNGEVTIFGTASSNFAKESAETDILEIPGVIKVTNQSVIIGNKKGLNADSELKTIAWNRLLWNPNIEVSNIDLNVNNGVVQITGTIDAYWKKIRVDELIHEIDGVKEVENELEVVPKHRYSDQEITENIISAVNRNHQINPDQIKINVQNGIVTLAGTVSEFKQVQQLYEIVRFTRGVRDIANMVQVYKKAA